MGVIRRPLIVIPRGVLDALPAHLPNAIKKPKGLKWEYHCAAANPAGASRLQSLPPVRRVAELGSLASLRYAHKTTRHDRSGIVELRLLPPIDEAFRCWHPAQYPGDRDREADGHRRGGSKKARRGKPRWSYGRFPQILSSRNFAGRSGL